MIRLLLADQLKNKGPERTAISCILANSPRYNTDLPVSRTGHQISLVKSSYELFCDLIWNLSHFLPKFEFSLIHSAVTGVFLHVHHH